MKPSSIMLPRVPVRPGGVERDLFRNQLVKRLAGIAVGRLQITQDTQVILDAGDQTATPLVVRIKQSRAYRQMVLGGPIGAAEAYMAGDWETDDLVGVLRLFLANRSVLEALDGGWNLLQKPLRRLHHFLNRDTIAQSKKNIAAHYDLGNDFFSLFLDPTMSYSGGVFETREDSMEKASINKFEAICRKLDLKPSDEVIEIGTGWGGFAMYAAEHYGCHVTTTTISEEQFAYADEEITRRGLKGRITLLKDDYRKLRGQYDKLVSIEMIEAVGLAYLPLFFQTCSRLLRPSGSLLIQAITIAESRFKAASKSVDFIQKYIFPGGALASAAELVRIGSAEEQGLRLYGLDDLTRHYAETMRAWADQFALQRKKMSELELSEAFLNMWEFYLAYCEAGFRERAIGLVHLQFHKSQFREG